MGIAADKIAKTGSKAAEGDGEFACGVAADDLIDRKAGQFGDIRQILAVIMDRDFNACVRRRNTGGEVAGRDGAAQLLGRQPFRAETDHQGTSGGHHVFDAIDRIGLKRGKQRQRLIEIGEFDKQDCQADG